MAVATDAGALCQSGVGGTGSGRKVLLWERDGVIEMRGCLDFACGVLVIGMAFGLISVGITGAPSVTIVIVQIGNWAMRSLFCLLWRASRLVSLFPA